MKDNTIEKNSKTITVKDTDGDKLRLMRLSDSVLVETFGKGIQIHRNGAIDLINFLKDKFEL